MENGECGEGGGQKIKTRRWAMSEGDIDNEEQDIRIHRKQNQVEVNSLDQICLCLHSCSFHFLIIIIIKVMKSYRKIRPSVSFFPSFRQ